MRTHSEPRDSTQRYSEGRARTRQSNRAAQPILTAMKQTLQLKLSQHLTLTPQLQQSIRLLQLSTVELNQELERYLTDNPLLERIDPATEATSAEEPREAEPAFDDDGGFGDDAPAGGGGARHDDEEREDFTQFAA